VTFTATVTVNAPGIGTPTGTVTFKDGASTLGTGTLSGGSTSFTTSGLAVGSHSITAVYGGDTLDQGSTSTALSQAVNQDGTSTSVASSANPSVSGQSVTFTATVSAVAPGSGTPTGTVTFMDGSTTLGSGNLSGGTASLTTAALAVGGHNITAVYGGDGNFTGSGSAALVQTVNQDGISVGVAASANPSSFGQSVTFTATVSAAAPGAGTPTGSVTFLDGGSALGTVPLSGGSATFSTATLGVGSHSITVSYSGDTNFTSGTSGTLAQTVNADGTMTTVASSLNPATYGQSVTFTANISASAPGAGTPTGLVTFMDGASTLGSGTLAGGQASFTTSTLGGGSHQITAVYQGDGNFATSTSEALSQTINPVATSTTLATSVNPTVYSQPVTFTATVMALVGGVGTPTGSVNFQDGSTVIGTASLDGTGHAVFSTTALAAGSHSVTAVYVGAPNFATSSSTALTQTVNKDGTATSLTSSDNPAVFSESITFTATVTANAPGTGIPTGTVTFKRGSTTLGTVTLDGTGHAAFTTSTLPTGNSSISAVYNGTGNFNSSTSGTINEKVNKASTTTVVVSSLNPSVSGQAVTFTATVSANAPAGGIPNGQVIFRDGGSKLATVQLDANGQASFTTTKLAVGSHNITVSYNGNTNFLASTSATLVQVVNAAVKPKHPGAAAVAAHTNSGAPTVVSQQTALPSGTAGWLWAELSTAPVAGTADVGTAPVATLSPAPSIPDDLDALAALDRAQIDKFFSGLGLE
jgi:hypothetical protein